jgi:pilus assembly protein TadC
MPDLTRFILRKYPAIKTNLRIAHNKQDPRRFVRRSLRLAVYLSITITVLGFFLLGKMLEPDRLLVVIPAVGLLSFPLILLFILQSPKSAIRKRQRDIDKEVLFAGRYLLVKMESGTPLVNTLQDASRGYGVSAKYFKEIIDEINTGTPVETALENQRTYNASEKFKRIIWQMVSALKTGTDVTGSLRTVIKSIGTQQILEVKEYGKKLNSLMLFYMVVACVAPSLGLTMFLIISGFLSLQLSNSVLFAILFFLATVQAVFLIMIKATRPLVDI